LGSDSGKRLAKVKPIAGRSSNRREEYGIKLPDAIVLATAQIDRYELVTRKAKVLPAYRE
jgi:PIN domain nuclease of toxin-antitoxin system